MAVTEVVGRQVIDLANDTNYYFEVAPQGDSQARYVLVTLLDHGMPYQIQGGSTIILEGKNAGGYNIFSSCQYILPNKIIIPLTNGVLSFAGVGTYSVAIYNGETVKSFPFNIVVTEAPYDINTVRGSDQYEALDRLIAKAASTNRWYVKGFDPIVGSPCSPDVSENDYYLNSRTGNVFYAKRDTTTDTLVWARLIDESSNMQVNIMGKQYVRYADDAEGTGFTKDPTDKKYIGFYSTVNLEDDTDPTLDINIPSNYSWSLITNVMDSSNTYTMYAIGDDDVTVPTTWSRTMPTVQPGKYLWAKVHITFYSGDIAEYTTVTRYGMDAGFDNPAATVSVTPAGGKSSATVTDSGDFTSKSFDFDFRIRAAEWKMGTEVSGSGVQTVTALNENNTIVGDMYLNTSTKVSYRCTAVTASSSTWLEGIVFDTVTSVEDLANTLRHYNVLVPGEDELVITGSDPLYVAADAEGDAYEYHIKYLTSVQSVLPNKSNPVVITDGAISSTLTFVNMNMDNMKVTPVGTENPFAKGWYEKNGDNYVLTSDTTVVSGKDYYTAVLICMEVMKKQSRR